MFSSKIRVESLKRNWIEIELYGGAARTKSAKEDPIEFLIHSDRIHVATTNSNILIQNYLAASAVADSYAGEAEVASGEEKRKVVVEPGEMASIHHDDADFRVSRHPAPTHGWSSREMKPKELGTGVWNKLDQPGKVELLTAPKTYDYPNGQTLLIDEISIAV